MFKNKIKIDQESVNKKVEEYSMKKKTYTRKDIARRASFKLNMSNEQTRLFIDCFFDVIYNTK